jgi:iron(III) transport system substrate-binding protein
VSDETQANDETSPSRPKRGLRRGSPLWIALIIAPWAAWAMYAIFGGQQGPTAREVVVYCAHDRLFSQPILDAFERKHGIKVRAKWDSEATKTTGLVQTLLAQRENPRCDVFWNNEVSQTIRLAQADALQAYESPVAAELPSWARDSAHLWTGFAARARVLIVNAGRVPKDQLPTSLDDLLDPKWKGQIGIAKPLYGTTATHVAARFAEDPAAGRAFFDKLKANGAVVCAGNADVKDRVAAGELAFGLTDTDDANLALEAGKAVIVVFPDQGPEGRGTLLIPNSVAIVKGAPHLAEAQALVDFLLSAEVEEALAHSRSVQIPLRTSIPRAAWIPQNLKAEPVKWPEVARAFPAARDYVQQSFLSE